jgi:hypothetical protein
MEKSVKMFFLFNFFVYLCTRKFQLSDLTLSNLITY